ncbi:MAG: hypothetical protein M0Z30_03250, partial [Actinomycetota bacterium]|nr:hypothetical protein [Actinomycetota bacterium]
MSLQDHMSARPASPTCSYDVRAELEELMERDLLGPRDGPDEELAPGDSPAERYLVGRLVPRSESDSATRAAPVSGGDADDDAIAEPMEDPDLEDLDVAGAAEEIDEHEPAAAVRSGRMASSAIGLSFSVPLSVESVKVTASWGRYRRVPSEIHETSQGRPRTVWRREHMHAEWTPVLGVAGESRLRGAAGQDGVELRANVRVRGRLRVVDVSLVNCQSQPAGSPDSARLYQVSITVTAADDHSAVFVGHNDPELTDPPSAHGPEQLQLAMLYRKHRRYGYGRYCAVDGEVRPAETRAWRLTTSCFPAADVPLSVPADAALMPGVILDMARLGSQDLA